VLIGLLFMAEECVTDRARIVYILCMYLLCIGLYSRIYIYGRRIVCMFHIQNSVCRCLTVNYGPGEKTYVKLYECMYISQKEKLLMTRGLVTTNQGHCVSY